MKTLEDIKLIYKDRNTDKQSLHIKWNHYEERRKEKIKILIEERENIIEGEKNGLWLLDHNGQLKVRLSISV